MRKSSILIADDQPDIVRLIVDHLNKNEYEWQVFRAGNGKEAFEVAKLEKPDLILMDWDMPELNGLEATRSIRKHEDTADIPVIMATGEMTSSENLQMALEAGAWDYVRKPIDFVELKARINSTLRLKRQQEEIKQLLSNEIDLKNRKLSTTSMLIVEKNSVIQRFDDDLSELAKPIEDTDRSSKEELLLTHINQIKKRLYHHLELDDSWATFKLHFEEVHPHFFQSLLAKGDDISQKDLKLCAYLKLGMDTKEIANLLNVTPASIRTAMYRLKKRLDIKEEESLRDFLMQLN
ncbi:response regulator [Reichenbachiella sp.]|uniref:response regulator n=1 Tax=Reichenbachiella sp. TaxID=2184521 RepID=UPI00329968AF